MDGGHIQVAGVFIDLPNWPTIETAPGRLASRLHYIPS